MGAWNYDIFSNDIAMDTVCMIEELSKELSLKDIIKEIKNNFIYKYDESKLVIADLELYLYDKISNEEEILDILNNELIENIDNKNYNERKVYIEKFINKIYNPINNLKPNINNWISEKRALDIL